MLFINAKFVLDNLGVVEPKIQQVQEALSPSMEKLKKLSAKADFMEMAATITDMFEKTVDEPSKSVPKKGKKGNETN